MENRTNSFSLMTFEEMTSVSDGTESKGIVTDPVSCLKQSATTLPPQTKNSEIKNMQIFLNIEVKNTQPGGRYEKCTETLK